jgi:hypothetical protein
MRNAYEVKQRDHSSVLGTEGRTILKKKKVLKEEGVRI